MRINKLHDELKAIAANVNKDVNSTCINVLYSGGLDSTFLACAFMSLNVPVKLCSIESNHLPNLAHEKAMRGLAYDKICDKVQGSLHKRKVIEINGIETNNYLFAQMSMWTSVLPLFGKGQYAIGYVIGDGECSFLDEVKDAVESRNIIPCYQDTTVFFPISKYSKNELHRYAERYMEDLWDAVKPYITWCERDLSTDRHELCGECPSCLNMAKHFSGKFTRFHTSFDKHFAASKYAEFNSCNLVCVIYGDSSFWFSARECNEKDTEDGSGHLATIPATYFKTTDECNRINNKINSMYRLYELKTYSTLKLDGKDPRQELVLNNIDIKALNDGLKQGGRILKYINANIL